MRKFLLYTVLVFIVPAVASAQRAVDTFKLYFDLNVPSLSESMQKKIDLLIYNDKILSGSKIMIVGYADYLGSEGYNNDLSMKRAMSVKDYLVKYGMNANDITLCQGKGKIERSGMTAKTGYATDRRVDIVVNNVNDRQNELAAPNKPAKYHPDSAKKKTTTLTGIPDVSKLKTGSTFVLKNVYFPMGRHIIMPESFSTLERLFKILKTNPNMKIAIEGHVCCVGDAPDAIDMDTFEPKLSVNRAVEIYNYLVQKGIEPSRLTYTGFGRRKPIVYDELTNEDMEKNRRVEVRITENK